MDKDDFLKLTLLILIVAIGVLLIGGIIITCIRCSNNRTLLEMRENKTTIMVAGESINPEDVKRFSDDSHLELEMKDGRKIKSTSYTFITPKPPVKVEK